MPRIKTAVICRFRGLRRGGRGLIAGSGPEGGNTVCPCTRDVWGNCLQCGEITPSAPESRLKGVSGSALGTFRRDKGEWGELPQWEGEVLRIETADRTGRHGPPAQDPGEDPFLRHDAVPRLVEDGAAGVTFLADLGHLQQRLADGEPGADRQGDEVDPFGGDIFGKVAGIDVEPQRRILSMLSWASRLTWRCQSPAWASPTMPCFSQQLDRVDGRLSLPLVFADTDGNDFCCMIVFSVAMRFLPHPALRQSKSHTRSPGIPLAEGLVVLIGRFSYMATGSGRRRCVDMQPACSHDCAGRRRASGPRSRESASGQAPRGEEAAAWPCPRR